jgi:hypothetical protein
MQGKAVPRREKAVAHQLWRLYSIINVPYQQVQKFSWRNAVVTRMPSQNDVWTRNDKADDQVFSRDGFRAAFFRHQKLSVSQKGIPER